jgi:hypothetical protein
MTTIALAAVLTSTLLIQPTASLAEQLISNTNNNNEPKKLL